ncbi:MAG: heavy-metal-associated domain-containing protein [Bifidobacteriaceae bacterium]|jgi:copper chaperone CopZ|nr:heavy-metal-associated domain-containing protein [Bifidobacteriaceae bacterium]
MISAVYSVKGMTCSHCVKAVQEELSALPGVVAVSVDLVPDAVSSVRIDSGAALDRAAVAGAIEEAGYEIVAG